MAYSRAAVSVGNLVSVARMKGRYASMRLGRSNDGCTAWPPAASTRRTVSRCACSCLAMVPTRHFSAACSRRIRAIRSGAMVMAPPWTRGAPAMAQEALAHPAGLRPGTAPAQPWCGGGGGGRGRGGDRGSGHRVGGRRVRRLGPRGGVVCPCGQWSRSHPGRATLVRHVLLKTTAAVIATLTASTAAVAPPPRPLRVGKPPAPRPLVSTCALAPSCVVRQAPARPAAVAIATVAVAAQHDLGAATRAQEQAPWSIHAHPGKEPKLRCWTDASQRCHTAAAPPSSAR